MSYKTALTPVLLSHLGASEPLAVMAKKFFICPKKVGGTPVCDDVKSLYMEWLETLQEHYLENGIEAKAIPNFSRDIPLVQRVYAICNGDKEAVRRLAMMFWTDERYTKYDPTLFLFAGCADRMLLDIARRKREDAD